MGDEGLDEKRYTLTEHLTELRARLGKAFLAVIATTTACLAFAPEILEYAVSPLVDVLRDASRVNTVLVHESTGEELPGALKSIERVRFVGHVPSVSRAAELIREGITSNAPIDLVLVSADVIGADGALVSDLVEGADPTPYVVYLVKDRSDPIIASLQLDGAVVVLDPPRGPVLKRVVQRAAAAAGKSARGDKLVVLSPIDPFIAYLKIAFVCGLFMACPVWLYQGWRFVAPGLYKKEKNVAMPAVVSGSLLFVAGGLFAYYAMFPLMFDVLVNQMMPASLVGSFTVEKYLSLLIQMTIAFGVVFELPLVLALLAGVGVVTADGLKKFRKYAIIGAFILGAVLTPADPISQTMMAAPLIIFYEVGIWAAVILGRRAEAKEALDEENASSLEKV